MLIVMLVVVAFVVVLERMILVMLVVGFWIILMIKKLIVTIVVTISNQRNDYSNKGFHKNSNGNKSIDNIFNDKIKQIFDSERIYGGRND